MNECLRGLKGLVPWLGVGIALLVAAAWRLYERRPRERRPGEEGLDDPALVQAFNWVAKTPQMRYLRGYAVRRALAMVQRGEAVDLGCGPGLYSSRLARLGHACTGIDFSPASVAYAREQAAAQGLDCRYHEGDVRRTDFAAGYGLVNGEQRMEMIRDPAIYQQFFSKLSKAVFLEAFTL